MQEAITGLSGLGRIVSQQVQISDLQATLDQLEKREATVRGQIARIRARLATESLDPETEAALRAKLQTAAVGARRPAHGNQHDERRGADGDRPAQRRDARRVRDGRAGVAHPPHDRRRADVLAWEGIILLGILIVLAPLALVGLAAWLGRRLYRKHEADRLLAT